MQQPSNLQNYSSSNQIAVYPNPSCGEFTIQIFNNEKINKISVLDQLGREIEFSITQNYRVYKITLMTHQAPRNCILKVRTENSIYTTHVLITK